MHEDYRTDVIREADRTADFLRTVQIVMTGFIIAFACYCTARDTWDIITIILAVILMVCLGWVVYCRRLSMRVAATYRAEIKQGR